jgi:hypothetical protein
MKLSLYKKWFGSLACALVLGGAAATQAASVTFSDISVATGAFGPVTVLDDVLDIDVSGFVADTSDLASGSGVTFDTIAFLVTANPGYYITSIKFTERGSATTDSASYAAATATWVVNGESSSLGFHVFPQGSDGSFELASTKNLANLTSVLVSITNNLFAFGTNATVSKSLGLVEVTTIPEPASILFLLTGLALVALVRQRRQFL